MGDDNFNRRGFLGFGGSLLLLPLIEACGAGPANGNTLIIGITSDPTALTSAMSTAGVATTISPKIFDGLLGYSRDLKPLPRLAQGWAFSEDRQTLRLDLRPGVKWHDGKPFTSADVAYSALEVWSKYHSRGRMTFANLVAVDTPDAQTAILRFSKPAPYVLSALASNESQVVPRHLYAGADVLSNPANIAPVGTGPFRFAEWRHGEFIRLERNREYWDKAKPSLDGIIFRLLPDGSAHAAALETGEIHMSANIPTADRQRLASLPGIAVDKRRFVLGTAGMGLEFNLDSPKLRDVRVRRAVAHAIDKSFILRNILGGNGLIDTGPISSVYTDFYTPDVPLYPFDLNKAKALLDEAGLKPDARGVRLSFTLQPTPGSDISVKSAEYVRDALGKIGIKVELILQDFATFVKRVYTDRDFEVAFSGGQMGPDPSIGTQRFYWSRSFKPGVAFSNGAHYSNPALDHALEAAQVETDPARRRDYFAAFQRIAQEDLPRIPIFTASEPIFMSRRLSPLPGTGEGQYGNFSGLTLSAG